MTRKKPVVKCPRCLGAGSIKARQASYADPNMPCDLCNESGLVPRGTSFVQGRGWVIPEKDEEA